MNRKSLTYYSKVAVVNVIVIIALFGLASVAGGWWLTTVMTDPAKADNFLGRRLAREYYRERRNVIQFQPDCALYDPGLTYTLRPGRCTFTNPEFSVEVEVNTQGLRDDEASLDGPEMIVLGDSYAMGWGVGHGETFASLIEVVTGLKVLNAGISSYGTTREMILLGRLDTRNLKYLVIQYNENDVFENLVFYRLKKLPIASERIYSKGVAKQLRTRKAGFADAVLYVRGYMTGRLGDLYGKIMGRLKAVGGEPPPEAAPAPARDGGGVDKDNPDEADLFVNALLSSEVDLSGVHILVIETNRYDTTDSEFVRALSDKLDGGAYGLDAAKVSILDVSRVLGEEDHFVLDDHINARGHKKIADLIMDAIR